MSVRSASAAIGWGMSAETVGIADNYSGLIDEVRQVNRQPQALTPARNPVIAKLSDIGRATRSLADHSTDPGRCRGRRDDPDCCTPDLAFPACRKTPRPAPRLTEKRSSSWRAVRARLVTRERNRCSGFLRLRWPSWAPWPWPPRTKSSSATSLSPTFGRARHRPAPRRPAGT